MSYKEHAKELLEEFYLCVKAKPKHNSVDLQLEKDQCEKLAGRLNNLLAWGDDSEIEEACQQFEPRLKRLKEKLVIEVLTHGI